MDNHFSGDHVQDFLGRKGWASTCTCRRDHLPKDSKKEHFHHKTQVPVDKWSKCAHYMNPIVAAKFVHATNPGDRAYVRTHVSFQSTGSTNISCVNALSECVLRVHQKSLGSDPDKRWYGLEKNQARANYLGLYSSVDSVDHLIKNVELKCCLWKWWHAPMRLAKLLVMVQFYFLYLKRAEGGWILIGS